MRLRRERSQFRAQATPLLFGQNLETATVNGSGKKNSGACDITLASQVLQRIIISLKNQVKNIYLLYKNSI